MNHQAQEALPYTVLQTYQGNLTTSTFSTLYNTCISSNAATINANVQNASAVGPGIYAFPVGSAANAGFAGLCSPPRAHVPGLSTGGAALLGAGYVGGPAGPFNAANVAAGLPYLGSNSPRLYDNPRANQTGNIDTTYANGPDFANNDYFGFSLTAQHRVQRRPVLQVDQRLSPDHLAIGTDLDGTPETLQEVTRPPAPVAGLPGIPAERQGPQRRAELRRPACTTSRRPATCTTTCPSRACCTCTTSRTMRTTRTPPRSCTRDYKLNDQWSFTAGGRYTDVVDGVHRRPGRPELLPVRFGAVRHRAGPARLCGYPLGGGTVDRYFPVGDNSQTWHVFDPTLAAQYHFSDDAMAYLSWGKGFKAGGWTTRLSANIPSAADAQFSPEYTKTWELGVKSEWFNHHLKANAAVFYTDYTGIQLDIQQGISPVYTNAGNAKIKGAELELQSVIGGGLSLNFSGSYIDAYYTYVNPNANIPQEILPGIGLNECPTTAINPATGGPVCNIVARQSAGRAAAEDAEVQADLLSGVHLRAARIRRRCASSSTSPTRPRCSTTR